MGKNVQCATHAGQPRAGHTACPECATTYLHTTHPHLTVLTPADLRSIFTPFLAAGWTWRDITHAIDTHPHRRRPRSTRPALTHTRAAAAAWIRRRMQSWHDSAGNLLPSPSQRTRRVAAERDMRIDPARYTPPRQCAGYQAIRELLAARTATPATSPGQMALLTDHGTVTAQAF